MRFLNKIAVEENMTLLTMHKTDSSQINAHVKIRLIIITHNLSFFLLLLLNVLKWVIYAANEHLVMLFNRK